MRSVRWQAVSIVTLALQFLVWGARSDGGQQLHLKDGFIFVEAHINGQGPFRLLVDKAVLIDSPAPDDADDGVLPTKLFSVVYVDETSVRLAIAH